MVIWFSNAHGLSIALYRNTEATAAAMQRMIHPDVDIILIDLPFIRFDIYEF